jgi:pimeloyl-ACP methyl ester carboxylesterase
MQGEPEILRKNMTQALVGLTLRKVVGSIANMIATLPEKPILLGHSMGGLAVQKLISLNKGVAGVCIDSAPPAEFSPLNGASKKQFSNDKSAKGNSVLLPSVEWFHCAFCNTMTAEQAQVEYDKFVVPESRNIAPQQHGRDGKIDIRKPHSPFLPIAGEKDHIIPATLNRIMRPIITKQAGAILKNSRKTHYICGQDNWEGVTAYIYNWFSNL